MDKEKDGLVVYEKSRYSKSNFLISAKYRSSLLENKITAISLAKIQKSEYTEENGCITCHIPASELKELLNGNDGSFYSQLEPVAQSMTSRSIGMSDPERGTFHYMAAITNADYENGVFTMRFNSEFKQYISNLKSNFTILELPVMLKFKSVYSFRLYELLTSKCYYPRGVKKIPDGVFKINFNLSELKLSMGVVNAELDAVRRELNNKEKPDYDKAVEKSPEKRFNNWYEFRRRVLNVAVEEINEKTELTVDFEPAKGGRGGKVHGVTFYVQEKRSEFAEEIVEPEKRELSSDEKEEIIYEMGQLFAPEGLRRNDIKAICEAANYDPAAIKSARDLLLTNKNVDNIVGWLISCIKEGYVRNGFQQDRNTNGTSKGSFGDFEQREDEEVYIKDIESALLKQD